MRKHFGAKPWTYPQPVLMLASYDENGVPDVMNAAWGGISCDTELCLCIGENHKSTKNILARREFTVSMATEATLAACDYVGVVSANDVPDKLARAGFTTQKAPNVDAPLICELPMAIECRLLDYDPESCHLFAEIVNVCADESVLTDGKIDPDKLKPITFDPVHLTYRALGGVAGRAFHDGLALKQE